MTVGDPDAADVPAVTLAPPLDIPTILASKGAKERLCAPGAQHTFTVELQRPRYAEEAYELYFRYNVRTAVVYCRARVHRGRSSPVIDDVVAPGGSAQGQGE